MQWKVCVSAIVGGGLFFVEGDTVTRESLGEHFHPLHLNGAISIEGDRLVYGVVSSLEREKLAPYPSG